MEREAERGLGGKTLGGGLRLAFFVCRLFSPSLADIASGQASEGKTPLSSSPLALY